MYVVIVALLAFLVALPASAQVQVNLGINFPAPPQMVVVSEVQSVQYVPTASANLFFYGGQYWVFQDGAWYYAGGYNGPWVVASPEYVPQPLLIVPVTYYRRPPPAWGGWHPGMPPQWGNNYGRSWSGKREVFVPGRGQAVHEQPVHAQPVQQPVHTQPAHEQAGQQPVHAQPAHEQPMHEQPGHAQPVHEEPAHAQAGHEQPVPQHAQAKPPPPAEHEKPQEHGGEEAHH
jgi:hypothetical protein